MNVSEERSQSLWMATAPTPFAPPLTIDEETDVVVIGSGIAGLSTAYELAVAGKEVVVLDRGPLTRGMTARTSAHLTWSTDDDFTRLIAIHGEEKAKLYHESHKAAIDRVEAIQNAESIVCQFARIDGYLFAPPKTANTLAREMSALHKLGIGGVSWAERAPAPGVDTGRCIRFADQARFHPLLYLSGLVTAISKRGGRFYADTTVVDIEETANNVTVTTRNGRKVRAKACVVATNSPICIQVNVHEKQIPYRTYVIAARLPKGGAEDALLWDTIDPYHYVRLYSDDDRTLLIVGGEDHKTAEANDIDRRFADLESWGRTHFPALGEVAYRWSGQVLEPRDCLAFIGRKPASKHIYFATGDSGDGLTHAVAAGLLISDLITKGESRWADLYNPARRPAKAPARFHREASKSEPKSKPPKIATIDELQSGHGAIIKKQDKEIAVFRDDAGRVHERSASCTHQGCTVQWNGFERCWDCPCHGSHFAADGTAINAPAVEPLEVVAEMLPRAHKAPDENRAGQSGAAR